MKKELTTIEKLELLHSLINDLINEYDKELEDDEDLYLQIFNLNELLNERG